MSSKFDQLVSELTTKNANIISKAVKSKVENRLPFNYVFGDKLRLIDNITKESSYYFLLKNLERETATIFDLEGWVVYTSRENYKAKKNPIKIGKFLNNLKSDYEKAAKFYEELVEAISNYYSSPEYEDHSISDENKERDTIFADIYNKNKGDKNIYLKNQSFYGFIFKELNWVELHSQHYINNINNDIKGIDLLLKVYNLQNQLKTQDEDLYILYTRAPMDIVRMSDFTPSFSSCHAEDGSYFNCALSEAVHGGILAVLIDRESKEILESKNLLDSEEIFADSVRDIEGVTPLARLRIRLAEDTEGNQLMVPEKRAYGNWDYTNSIDFKKSVEDWVKSRMPNEFNWDSMLSLRGGSYEDNDLSYLILTTYGKTVNYKYNNKDTDLNYRSQIDETYLKLYNEAKEVLTTSEAHFKYLDTKIGNAFGLYENPDISDWSVKLNFIAPEESQEIIFNVYIDYKNDLFSEEIDGKSVRERLKENITSQQSRLSPDTYPSNRCAFNLNINENNLEFSFRIYGAINFADYINFNDNTIDYNNFLEDVINETRDEFSQMSQDLIGFRHMRFMLNIFIVRWLGRLSNKIVGYNSLSLNGLGGIPKAVTLTTNRIYDNILSSFTTTKNQTIAEVILPHKNYSIEEYGNVAWLDISYKDYYKKFKECVTKFLLDEYKMSYNFIKSANIVIEIPCLDSNHDTKKTGNFNEDYDLMRIPVILNAGIDDIMLRWKGFNLQEYDLMSYDGEGQFGPIQYYRALKCSNDILNGRISDKFKEKFKDLDKIVTN